MRVSPRWPGQHTLKTGYYYFRSLQRRGAGNVTGNISFANDANNPLDTSFGFSNAAVGVFSTYAQTSRWAEGAYLAVNHEAFIQDNWRVSNGVTLDYGVRFVHMRPQYRRLRLQRQFPARPVERRAGAAAVRRRLRDQRVSLHGRQPPRHGSGDRSDARCRTLRSRSARSCRTPARSPTACFPPEPGRSQDTYYTYPTIGITPRFGAAWDVQGNQRFVVRGGAGLFYDRAPANSVYGTVNNPPFTRNVTVRYGQLQNLSSTGLATEAAPSLTVWEYDSEYAASTQWNVGLQMMLPFSTALDIAYTGQHSYDANTGVNINAIDLGLAFLPSTQNPAAADVAHLHGSDDVLRCRPTRTSSGFTKGSRPSISSSRLAGARTTRSRSP